MRFWAVVTIHGIIISISFVKLIIPTEDVYGLSIKLYSI